MKVSSDADYEASDESDGHEVGSIENDEDGGSAIILSSHSCLNDDHMDSESENEQLKEDE